MIAQVDWVRGNPDIVKRNEEIANAGESKNGGWSIGQLLQKPKGSTSRTKSQVSYGVVVEVVLLGDQDNDGSDAYPWPWVLWEGDDEVSNQFIFISLAAPILEQSIA